MSTQAIAEIRNLTSEEVEDVSGAMKIVIGPFKLKVLEDGLILSVAIEHVGSINVDTGGVWVGL